MGIGKVGAAGLLALALAGCAADQSGNTAFDRWWAAHEARKAAYHPAPAAPQAQECVMMPTFGMVTPMECH